MITIYDLAEKRLHARPAGSAVGPGTVWIDLVDPTPQEEAAVEAALGIAVPTRAEMREIEPSSRHYKENGAHYMTALIVYNIEKTRPDTGSFTFILAGKRLVTVRYGEAKSFPLFVARAQKGEEPCGSASEVMIGLVEAVIAREADLIERIQDEVDRLTQSIFDIKGGQQTRNRRLDVTLRSVGREGDVTSRAQEATYSLDRMLMFFLAAARERGDEVSVIQRIEAARSDIATLSQHAQFLSSRTTFMLEATLGMINTEQNQIIKLFSVVAVMLMPPTLVASIYGMNFKHMPELDWQLGYPMALVLMLLSAVLPFIYFRRKGWL